MATDEDRLKFFVTHRGIVSAEMCDHLGHMNVQFYAKCFGDAAFAIMNRLGLGPRAIATRRLALIAVRMEVDYVAEVRSGAILTTRSAVADAEGKKITFFHRLFEDETQKLTARAKVMSVCMNLEGRHACDIPEDIRLAVTKLNSGC